MSEDTGWLIEHQRDPRFGRESWYGGKDGFTTNSLWAVRFARKQDAEREIDRFPTTLAAQLIATQHSWVPAMMCVHGQAERECKICDALNETARWKAAAAAAKEEAGTLRMRLNQYDVKWNQIGESLREFGHDPASEGQWVAMVHRALAELDRRSGQRTSDPNLLVEIVATPDDTSEDSEWIILHARLEKFLKSTGVRGLKNLLGTVTMLRDRVLDIGDEVLAIRIGKDDE